MDSYWAGRYIKLRLFKGSDKDLFFIKDNHYRIMIKGHLEYESTTSTFNFDSYFDKNRTMSFDHDFSLILCDVRSDFPLGILQVFDTNSRNGTYFLGLYLDSKYEIDKYYRETIMIIKDFLYNHLRYHSGFIVVDNRQVKLLSLLKSLKFDQTAVIKDRYNQRFDQYLFAIKNEV